MLCCVQWEDLRKLSMLFVQFTVSSRHLCHELSHQVVCCVPYLQWIVPWYCRSRGSFNSLISYQWIVPWSAYSLTNCSHKWYVVHCTIGVNMNCKWECYQWQPIQINFRCDLYSLIFVFLPGGLPCPSETHCTIPTSALDFGQNIFTHPCFSTFYGMQIAHR